MAEFFKYPKIPRLNNSDWIITEKLDGTNAIIYIKEISSEDRVNPVYSCAYRIGDKDYLVLAGSRNGWLLDGRDNHGFREWVEVHALRLILILGEGRHYGEWWGKGINRGYGLATRHFSLFSPHKYPNIQEFSGSYTELVTTVPVLADNVNIVDVYNMDEFYNVDVDSVWYTTHLDGARVELNHSKGSVAVPGYYQPEGYVLEHKLTGAKYKYIISK